MYSHKDALIKGLSVTKYVPKHTAPRESATFVTILLLILMFLKAMKRHTDAGKIRTELYA